MAAKQILKGVESGEWLSVAGIACACLAERDKRG